MKARIKPLCNLLFFCTRMLIVQLYVHYEAEFEYFNYDSEETMSHFLENRNETAETLFTARKYFFIKSLFSRIFHGNPEQ